MSEETNSPPDTAALITALSQLWEKYNLQDDELWQSFRETFKGHTEEDFKIPHNVQLQKLRALLRNQGVWVLKDPKTEEEVTRWKNIEIFKSDLITHLIETEFGRKPKWKVPKPMFSGPSSTYQSAHSPTSMQDQQPIEQGRQSNMPTFPQRPFQYSPIPERPLPQQPFRQNQGQWSEHSAHQIPQQSLLYLPPQPRPYLPLQPLLYSPLQPLPYSPLQPLPYCLPQSLPYCSPQPPPPPAASQRSFSTNFKVSSPPEMQSEEVIQQPAHRLIWNQSEPQAKSANTTNLHIGTADSPLVPAAPAALLAIVTPLSPSAQLAIVPLALLAPDPPVAPVAQVSPLAAPVLPLASISPLALVAPQQMSGQPQQLFSLEADLSFLVADPSPSVAADLFPLVADQLLLKRLQHFQSNVESNQPTKSAITTDRLANHAFLHHITLKDKTIKNNPATIAAHAAAYRDAIALFCQVKVQGSVWRLILQQPLPDWVRKGKG
ncbi:hypothetical protein MMC29_000606 [Sticta canariensis]|nr:hypothetical protein [Sticta canariensis]